MVPIVRSDAPPRGAHVRLREPGTSLVAVLIIAVACIGAALLAAAGGVPGAL
jgi:hypothetical protein